MGCYWDMYCITKHINYCTFFGGHLKGNITQVKYLHFLFLNLITAKNSIYEQLFPKAKDCHLSLKEKGRLTLKLKQTFLFFELLYCDSVIDSMLENVP